ncbi:hypothetical protein GCM10027395_04620 [Giesbergeria sinuosa]
MGEDGSGMVQNGRMDKDQGPIVGKQCPLIPVTQCAGMEWAKRKPPKGGFLGIQRGLVQV